MDLNCYEGDLYLASSMSCGRILRMKPHYSFTVVELNLRFSCLFVWKRYGGYSHNGFAERREMDYLLRRSNELRDMDIRYGNGSGKKDIRWGHAISCLSQCRALKAVHNLMHSVKGFFLFAVICALCRKQSGIESKNSFS